MTPVRTFGLAAVGAAALLAAPLPAFAAAAEPEGDPSTGSVTVTFFEDRYPDGLFDPSSTSPNGMYQERKRSELALNLIDINGDRHYQSANAEGDFVFENVPVGAARVYLPDPNSYVSVAFFDATGATSAADIERLPGGSYNGVAGVLDVTVDADGEFRLVGMTALRVAADIQLADGTAVSGAGVEFASAGTWYAGEEYWFQAGSYEAISTYHLPGDLGVRVTPPAGYGVVSVVAGNNAGDSEIPVTARDGGWWFSSTQAADYFWNPTFTVTLEQLPDTTRPEVTLVTPTAGSVLRQLDVRVDATDDRGLQRIVANIYRDGTLVKSTQTRLDGATSGIHTATVTLPDGSYTVKYNAQDTAGNISRTSTAAFTIDTVAPTVTVKTGERYTVVDGESYELVSFKLFDARKIAYVEINGVKKDLTDNTWSDVNFVAPGVFGGREGENTIIVYDVAGNATTLTFNLS